MKYTLTINGHIGTVVVAWNEDHYEAFIIVPYKPSRWINLYTCDKDKATDKALKELKIALLRCGMC